MVIEVEEYDPKIDALAELTYGGQFVATRTPEVLHFVQGLFPPRHGRVLAATVRNLILIEGYAPRRANYSATIAVTFDQLQDTPSQDDLDRWFWHARAVPALGFGELLTQPLHTYQLNVRLPDALRAAARHVVLEYQPVPNIDELHQALYKLATRWVHEGGYASVVPSPRKLAAESAANGWPLAAEVLELWDALAERATALLAHGYTKPEGSSDVARATAALATQLKLAAT